MAEPREISRFRLFAPESTITTRITLRESHNGVVKYYKIIVFSI